MRKHINDRALTFDDILLVPRYSDISAKQVDVSTVLTHDIDIKVPILSAAMDTVTESAMAISMAQYGGVGVIHKNMRIEKQTREIKAVKQADVTKNSSLDKNGRLLVAAAVDTSNESYERLDKVVEAEADVIVVDSAHGNSKYMIDFIKYARKKYPHIQLVAGNVVTYDTAKALVDAGAYCIKVGVGPGSICTTRVVSGVGMPQITAIQQCKRATEGTKVTLIADGGIRTSGDIVKAIAAGADSVMIGSLLAGTDESPGSIIEKDGTVYKQYRGMGSVAAMAVGSGGRYEQSDTPRDEMIPEGVEATIKYVGHVHQILHQLVGGLRSGMSYCGAHNINELQWNSEYVVITNSGLHMSHVHDLSEFVKPLNYSK